MSDLMPQNIFNDNRQYLENQVRAFLNPEMFALDPEIIADLITENENATLSISNEEISGTSYFLMISVPQENKSDRKKYSVRFLITEKGELFIDWENSQEIVE